MTENKTRTHTHTQYKVLWVIHFMLSRDLFFVRKWLFDYLNDIIVYNRDYVIDFIAFFRFRERNKNQRQTRHNLQYSLIH